MTLQTKATSKSEPPRKNLAPLLAFYGDDFTGSADVMEVLQWHGLRTVLFLDPPSQAELDQFVDLKAFGVAGWSRNMSPIEMERELTPILQRLRSSNAKIVHYKICSTFDSSPTIGSIGKALEIGRDIFQSGIVPIVVGAPNLGRYQAFGNLFARSGLDTEPFRLDRHPTMQCHPITAMSESDLRKHLALQTKMRVGLFDLIRLNERLPKHLSEPYPPTAYDALLFDAIYPEHLTTIGHAIDELAMECAPKFVIGSSGIEYAMTAAWSEKSLSEKDHHATNSPPKFASTDQLVAITGSCSPVNARQIEWAERNGMECIALDPAMLIQPKTRHTSMEQAVEQALKRLRNGDNVILHSSRGPDDPRVPATIAALRSLGLTDHEVKLQSGRRLGPLFGKILADILAQYPVARVGVAGGDTSGYIARELGITALEAIAPVAPGSPLCRIHATNKLNGVEFIFKGGQVGKDNVWGTLLNGNTEINLFYQQNLRKVE